MSHPTFLSPDQIRSLFSSAMSQMYRQEVPQYGQLVDLVSDINAQTLQADAPLKERLHSNNEMERLAVERHGAIRLGKASELAMMRRIFGVMGMLPVGYYDLSVAGVPVHSTAFRPVADAALALNPFRVFTSLLRLELIEDTELRQEIADLLAQREIFTPRAIALTTLCEQNGGMTADEAQEFVAEVRETFRWHNEATVDEATYHRLHDAHRLIADVACFKGPHINHLTPRTLDIDAAQLEMPKRGMAAKDVVEGPPRRKCPILLRQTSFKALEERVAFLGADTQALGTHTARFGEIEQRGMALTRKGRALYDQLLERVRKEGGNTGASYAERLTQAFADFPDDEETIRLQELAFFSYALTEQGQKAAGSTVDSSDMNALIARGWVKAQPITYEDFLPVSAAGIFQSNLGGTEQKSYEANQAQAVFEAALGSAVQDEIALYASSQAASIARVQAQLRAN